MNSRRGVFGGTFDPPHLGHLRIADAALRALDLDHVVFVVAGNPWQKPAELVSLPSHRWAMTTLAVAGEDRFVPSRIELDRWGPSYMIDTLETLAQDTHWSNVVILGADAARNLNTWHRAPDIVEANRIAVVNRPGVASVERVLGVDVASVPVHEVGISSSQIRQRVKAGDSLAGLVPDAVGDYIVEFGLYADQDVAS